MTNITTSILLCAIMQVESGGNPLAKNYREDAVGVLQIRPILVQDVNRILQQHNRAKRFTLEDRYIVESSFQMARIYLSYYCEGMSPESKARCWNGGPTGYKKKATLSYWVKVQKVVATFFDIK